MNRRARPSFLWGLAKRSTGRPRWCVPRCFPARSCLRGANMLDRRINKLKENLMRQADEALVVRHLVDANPRGDDMLGEVCRAAVLLHPSASFEQALTLARTMAYIVYIDDYLEEEHPELDLADYRRECQNFFLLAHPHPSPMPPLNAPPAPQNKEQFRQGEVPPGLKAMGPLIWEKKNLAVRHLMEEEFEQLKKAIARERRTGITQQFLSHLIDSTQVLLDFYEVPGGRHSQGRPDRVLKAS